MTVPLLLTESRPLDSFHDQMVPRQSKRICMQPRSSTPLQQVASNSGSANPPALPPSTSMASPHTDPFSSPLDWSSTYHAACLALIVPVDLTSVPIVPFDSFTQPSVFDTSSNMAPTDQYYNDYYYMTPSAAAAASAFKQIDLLTSYDPLFSYPLDDCAPEGDNVSMLSLASVDQPYAELSSCSTSSSTSPSNGSIGNLAASEALTSAAATGLSPAMFSYISPSAAPAMASLDRSEVQTESARGNDPLVGFASPASTSSGSMTPLIQSSSVLAADVSANSRKGTAGSASAQRLSSGRSAIDHGLAARTKLNKDKRWSVGSYVSPSAGVVNIYDAISNTSPSSAALLTYSPAMEGESDVDFKLPACDDGELSVPSDIGELHYVVSSDTSVSSPNRCHSASEAFAISPTSVSADSPGSSPLSTCALSTRSSVSSVASAMAVPPSGVFTRAPVYNNSNNGKIILGKEHLQSEEDECPQDFYAPFTKERLAPPASDFECVNPDDVPRKQDARFEGDLYTPLWIRKKGDLKEGWCDMCAEPRWLILKNSAYWYDKNFAHGICPMTGHRYERPTRCRRIKGNEDMFEGLCGVCNQWIQITTRRGGGGTSWFRHANRCHNYERRRSDKN
ncbi:uncharacterized protein V1516DRAFT_685735 [Lipomyces oligophaga]|uniref:uncharacterized protein n=1 Tax=Lipomyces oligophaga TaxID=45792 RepID=UPI0034CD06F7